MVKWGGVSCRRGGGCSLVQMRGGAGVLPCALEVHLVTCIHGILVIGCNVLCQNVGP